MGWWCKERHNKDENNKLEGVHQKPDQMEETRGGGGGRRIRGRRGRGRGGGGEGIPTLFGPFYYIHFHFKGTVKLLKSGTHRLGHVPYYEIFWTSRQQPHWPKFLHIIFWYCSYIWAAKLIRGLLNLDIFLSCWLFKSLQPALTECEFISYFHFIIKKTWLSELSQAKSQVSLLNTLL